MDYAAFLQAAGRGQPPPIALLPGPGPQLLDDALAAATRWLCRDAGEAALGREVFEPAEAAVGSLAMREGRSAEAWLRQRAGAEGLTVSEEAARLLVQWVGDDGDRLLGETRKAALAGGSDNAAVGVKEVTAVVGEHRLSGV